MLLSVTFDMEDDFKRNLRFVLPNSTLFFEKYLEFSEFLSKGLGITYEWASTKIGGALLQNGTWTGAIRMVQAGEVDLAVLPLVITDERRKVVNFSYPFQIDSITYATPKFVKSPTVLAIFHPFSFPVWFSLLASFIAMSVVIISLYYSKNNFLYVLLRLFAYLLRQNVPFRYNNHGEKYLMFIWITGAFIITNCYMSVLLSSMTVPTIDIVKDIPSLSSEVKAGRYQTMIRKTSPYPKMLLESADELARIIGKSISENPNGLGSIEEFLKSGTQKIAFVEVSSLINFLRGEYFISADSFFIDVVALAVRNNFCCKEKLDMVIHRISASGLYEKLLSVDEFKSAFNLASTRIYENTFPRALKLIDLSGAFFVLITGFFISFMVLAVEILFKSK